MKWTEVLCKAVGSKCKIISTSDDTLLLEVDVFGKFEGVPDYAVKAVLNAEILRLIDANWCIRSIEASPKSSYKTRNFIVCLTLFKLTKEANRYSNSLATEMTADEKLFLQKAKELKIIYNRMNEQLAASSDPSKLKLASRQKSFDSVYSDIISVFADRMLLKNYPLLEV